MDTVEEGGPNSLSEKFSNGTSTMYIEDKSFGDSDSDDDAESYLPKVVEVVGGVSSSLSTLSTAFILAIVLSIIEMIEDKGENVVPKRVFEDEGDAVDSRRVKEGSNGSFSRNYKIDPNFSKRGVEPHFLFV
ncbi:hypothetical protein Adt_05343 [Abeliophyllum distichum]|uniref:Uncharacterized protein n=1 Tax=Abeliophyllum distichum TaxID=126358 RepID=A0ABD1V3U4_9LAMI